MGSKTRSGTFPAAASTIVMSAFTSSQPLPPFGYSSVHVRLAIPVFPSANPVCRSAARM
jgi:hypothetical protein